MPHRVAARTATAFVLLAALGACGGDPADESSAIRTPGTGTAAAPSSVAPTAAATTPAPEPPASTPAESDVKGESEPLTLAFVGDMNFESAIGERLSADPATVYGAAEDDLGAADLTFGNLETSVGTTGSSENKTYTFQAPPSAFEALSAAGFDAVSMANNHAADFGAAGLADTVAAIADTDVKVAGIGPDAAAAYAPVFLEAKGRRVAFLAALDLHDETWNNWGATDDSPGVARYDDRFVASVRSAAQDSDLTIAYLHWAPENETCPDPDIAPPIVDALIAAGADIVVGAHAHMLQGAGWRGGVFVSYGLGNYLWYSQRTEITTRTGILTVTVDGDTPTSYEYAPARIESPSGIPTPLAGADAADAQTKFEELRSCTNLTATRQP